MGNWFASGLYSCNLLLWFNVSTSNAKNFAMFRKQKVRPIFVGCDVHLCLSSSSICCFYLGSSVGSCTGCKHQDTENRAMPSHTKLSNGDRWSQQRERAVGVSLDRIISLVCELLGSGFAKQSLLIFNRTSKWADTPIKLKGFRLQGTLNVDFWVTKRNVWEKALQ